jgi:hypothetical protein
MELVIIESPFAGKGETREERAADREENINYARKAMHDCLMRGEAPYASHLLYTQDGVLDDTVPSERELGINAGFKWAEVAKKRVVYTDRGISKGMRRGIDEANRLGQEVEFRSIEEGE